MPPEEIGAPGNADALHDSLRAAIGAHLDALTKQHADALQKTRRDAAAEAEEAMSARIEAVRAEWAERLERELTQAHREAEQRLMAAATNAREEAEQVAADTAARGRDELERTLTAERERSEEQMHAAAERAHTELEAQLQARSDRAAADLQAELQAERERAAAELERERERARMELEQERERARGEAEAARERAAQAAPIASAAAHGAQQEAAPLAGVERLLESVKAIGSERTLTGVFDRLIDAIGASASRVLLLVVSGDRLRGLKASGFSDVDAGRLDVSFAEAGLLGDAARTGEGQSATSAASLPDVLAPPAGRTGFAAPLMVGGHVVAILYADNGGADDPAARAGWLGTVQLLARHASIALALVTATRTLQALGAASDEPSDADDQSARRYARLLVSEIKLYNESAVRVGREKRDLLGRLATEIDRARRLYEERIPPAVGARAQYFQQELVHTLADGDPSLLGRA